MSRPLVENPAQKPEATWAYEISGLAAAEHARAERQLDMKLASQHRDKAEALVERVEYDGEHGIVSITFHPCGIKSLTQELASQQEDAA